MKNLKNLSGGVDYFRTNKNLSILIHHYSREPLLITPATQYFPKFFVSDDFSRILSKILVETLLFSGITNSGIQIVRRV
ncbi:MAG: hypothetical protein ACLQO6_15280 [Desulfomonilaceae bacterium]